MKSARLTALAVLPCLAFAAAALPGVARAAAGGAEWRLEQPLPPKLAEGQQSPIPVGLGKIGDIEFFSPNRGLLITAGNPPTIPPGLWAYNGQGWHELATVCGASDGRIVWAGPDEFWTISDGRPGQASSETLGAPPLADNTLCRFQGQASERGEVAASYATLAFRTDSYQAMHAGACLSASDCWFGGDPLPEGQVGAFHLHWDGSALTEVPNPQGHAIEDMRVFGERFLESVRLLQGDRVSEEEPPFEPSVMHLIRPAGSPGSPFLSLKLGVPKYREGEFPTALDFLHLGADEESLWGAANPVERPPAGSAAGEVTIVRDLGGLWSQLIGPGTDPAEGNPFTKFIPTGGTPGEEEAERERRNEVVSSIAPEPGSESAWVALSSRENQARGSVAPAMVARVDGDATVSERQTLPTEVESAEGVGPKGPAEEISCPAVDDCWLATARGWLFHLADEAHRTLPTDSDPAFAGLITYRPPDAGVPPVVPDAPPLDDSGLLGELPPSLGSLLESKPAEEARTTVALVSHVRVRVVHGDMLELRFHLAARARVRLVALRRRKVVARTPRRTFAAGNRRLLLRLDPRRWPTKLDLQTHALGKLPSTSLRGAGNGSVSTAMQVLPRLPAAFAWELKR
jgi:hypothetical protein